MANVTTLNRWLFQQGRRYFPKATGDFSAVITHIALATKIISKHVAYAGLIDILGKAGHTNVSADDVAKLDEFANDFMKQMLSDLTMVCAMASEEDEEIQLTGEGRLTGQYMAAFDPLDGSSNIDANVTIGTIFSIRRRFKTGYECTWEDFLDDRSEIVAAGYTVYGSSTMLVLTTGQGVHGFTLDPEYGEFLLTQPIIKYPDQVKCLSINEANRRHWHPETTEFVDLVQLGTTERFAKTTSRYIGSLVADFHRNLLYGGIFLYPADKKAKQGKLRLLYECQPLAWISEMAGGGATNGLTRILDADVDRLHAKSGFIAGTLPEVILYEQLSKKYAESGGIDGPSGDGIHVGRGA